MFITERENIKYHGGKVERKNGTLKNILLGEWLGKMNSIEPTTMPPIPSLMVARRKITFLERNLWEQKQTNRKSLMWPCTQIASQLEPGKVSADWFYHASGGPRERQHPLLGGRKWPSSHWCVGSSMSVTVLGRLLTGTGIYIPRLKTATCQVKVSKANPEKENSPFPKYMWLDLSFKTRFEF